jgi:ABC-2 type transport system ATP-binding protein
LSSILLTARGVSKRFGSKLVLDDATFSVREREVLGLIGPNGAGKTTLFECLAGLIPRDAGDISATGGMFYLPDAIRPWPDQSVGWALRFFESLYSRRGLSAGATSDAPYGRGSSSAIPSNEPRPQEAASADTSTSTNSATGLMAALKLQPFLNSRIGSLSKGECKRFLLALGLLTPQPLLLLDEPFDGLDFRQTRDVMALLRTIPRTLFLSIHQLPDAARVCDRLILLSNGRVAGEGTLDDLRAQAGLPNAGLEEIFLALT